MKITQTRPSFLWGHTWGYCLYYSSLPIAFVTDEFLGQPNFHFAPKLGPMRLSIMEPDLGGEVPGGPQLRADPDYQVFLGTL